MQVSHEVLRALCKLAELPSDDLNAVDLAGELPRLRSSFRISDLAQISVASAAYAAAQFGKRRGITMPNISVDIAEAERECTGYFKLDGVAPDSWAPLSGLYPCKDGYVRIHANFEHHRDGACHLLGLLGDPNEVTKADVANRLLNVEAVEFETAAARLGLPIFAVRAFDQWDKTAHAQWLQRQPLLSFTKIGDANPKAIPELKHCTNENVARPLDGIRVLDLTRILAGPVCGRTLAHYGAQVMLVNSPKLPNIAHIADTSRGKRSVHLDLQHPEDSQTLASLTAQTHVFVQGYRPGGLTSLGFSPQRLAAINPGIVSVSLSAFGSGGDWADRRGFDSLVQTAMGFNLAEAQALGVTLPTPFPIQILDFASGFLMAFATSAALLKQQQEGGSWHVEVSLAQTGQFLRNLGRIECVTDTLEQTAPVLDSHLLHQESGFGLLSYLPHSARFNRSLLTTQQMSVRPGSNSAAWK